MSVDLIAADHDHYFVDTDDIGGTLGRRCWRCGFAERDVPAASAPSLTDLAKKFKTDKWGTHRYTPHYDLHFSPWRYREINLLEIGIGGYAREGQGGASLRMWREYFPKANIYGLDIEDKSFVDSERITTYQGSQTDEQVLRRILDDVGELHIIIDDGSHRVPHVLETFRILFPQLHADGIYVIEDIQSSYWPEWGGAEELHVEHTSMGLVKRLLDGLNYEEFVTEPYTPTYEDEHVTEVHAYHNLVFLQKGQNREGTFKRRILKDRYPDG